MGEPLNADGENILTVVEVTAQEFFADATGWDDLVERSGIDPLFNGHAWQSSWWEAFGSLHALQSYFLVVRSGSEIVARAPLFRRSTRDHGIPVRTVEWVGNLWRGPATFRSEFLDLASAPEARAEIVSAVLGHIAADRRWGELLLVDLAGDSSMVHAVPAHDVGAGRTRRISDGRAFEVRIAGSSLQRFTAELTSSARRSMFGQRRRLEALGPVRVERGTAADREAIQTLDRLHAARWGSGLLTGGRETFLGLLAGRMQTDSLLVSILCVGDRKISALLQARVGDREYNLQGGFEAGLAPGLSPARLHWGCVIEEAFRTGMPETLDLLVGRGQKADFKADFAAQARDVVSIQVVRHPALGIAYRAKNAIEKAFGQTAVQ